MGDYGIAGLWTLLAASLVAAVLVAAGAVLLADRTLPKPVGEGHNSALSPFDLCQLGLWRPARLHNRGGPHRCA